MTSKLCPCCQEDKPLSDYCLRANGKPESFCRKCQAICQKRYRDRVAADPDRAEQYRKQRSKWAKQYRLTRKERGQPIKFERYLRMSERYNAILQLL